MDRDYDVGRPLFDRLTDLDPERQAEARPARSLDRRGLRESVRHELECLFNTRSPWTAADLEARPPTVLEYGVPDFSTFSPHNPEDCRRLAGHLKKAAEAFEPRLAEVEVKVETATSGHDLWARLDAVMVIDGVREPVSFPTVFHDGRARVAVAGD